MNVVWHQAVRDHTEFVTPGKGMQETQVGLRISVAEEHAVTVISALGDVMEDIGKYRPALAGHR